MQQCLIKSFPILSTTCVENTVITNICDVGNIYNIVHIDVFQYYISTVFRPILQRTNVDSN